MDAIRIIEQAVLHKNIPIESTYGKRWLNEAQQFLANMYDTACVEDSFWATVESDTESAPLPERFRGINRVIDEMGDEVIYFDTGISSMRFPRRGTYEVRYIKAPKILTGDFDTPEIHEAYHMPIAKYIAAMELADIKPQKSRELLQIFYNEAGDANARLSRRVRKHTRLPAPEWR